MSVKSSRLAVIGVGFVLFAAGIAGCGGDDDGDSGPLTKDEFIAQADQICADATASTDAQEEEFNSAIEGEDLEAAADLLTEGNTTVEDAIAEIEALEPPEEDQATVDEFIELSHQQADLGTELADAVRAGDGATIDELSAQANDLEEQSDTLADDYGMVDCGSASDDDA